MQQLYVCVFFVMDSQLRQVISPRRIIVAATSPEEAVSRAVTLREKNLIDSSATGFTAVSADFVLAEDFFAGWLDKAAAAGKS